MKNYKNRSIFTFKLFLLGLLLPCEFVRPSSSQNNVTGSMLFAGTAIVAMLYNTYQKNAAPLNAEQKNTDPIMDINQIDAKSYPELEKFIKKYRCSAEFETRVNLSKFFHEVVKTKSKNKGTHEFNSEPANDFAKMPGLFIKGPEIDRIINAERMKKVIEINNLDCLKVADKCLAIDGDSLCVVGKAIIFGDQKQKISLKEVKQLFRFAIETGFYDWQFGDNVIRDINGKLVFIDTEDRSYYGLLLFGDREIFKKKVYVIGDLSKFRCFMDNDAQAWFETESEKIENSDEAQERLIILPTNSQYDAAIGIDFEKVRREFHEFKSSKNKDIEHEKL